MNSTGVKLLVAAIFFFSTLICSLIPTIVSICYKKCRQLKNSSCRNHFSIKTFTSCLSCFGGGVFLGVCLLDLLPEVVDQVNQTLKTEFNYDNEDENDYPFGEILVMFGFFIVLFVEQTILSVRSSTKYSTSLIVPHKDNKNEQILLMDTENPSVATREQISINDSTKDLTTTRNFLMILSLVIHSIFEGLAIGSLKDSRILIQLSIAILIHKSIIAFSVGMKLISNKKKRSIYVSCLIFAFATPIGILLMLTMEKFLPNNRSTKIINSILHAFACGTFFYVTFFDVLPHELNSSAIPKGTSCISRAYRLIKTFCIFIGFICTSILLIATK